MALTTIKASTAAHVITIASVAYTAVTDTCNIRSTAPVETEVTFANETTGGEFSVGTETMQIELGGILKFDGTGATPGFLPLSAYQDKTFSITYVTGCIISGTCSAFAGGPDNVRASLTRRWSAAFQITGPVTITWDIAGA
jgi:exosortase/archaeosortase